MKYSLLNAFFLVSFMGADVPTPPAWTWLYKKTFTAAEKACHAYRSSLFFSKEDTPQFNQLIFSWNAFRPEKGFYRFKARVRNAKTKKWYSWHTMAEWGNDVQRSFLEKSLWGTQFFHVRLELPVHHYADALAIKVEAVDGATCADLHGLYVSVSNLQLFSHESVQQLEPLHSLHIRTVPALSQMLLDHPKKEVLCSPTSCSMLISYLTKNKVNPVEFATRAHDKGLDAYGSWPFNSAHAFELCKGNYGFYVQRLPSFAALYKYIQRKIPVVVSVRGALKGAPKDYNDGHLLVVVGWDAYTKKVICHDPAFDSLDKTCIAYDAEAFLKAWECSRRLSYIAQPLS